MTETTTAPGPVPVLDAAVPELRRARRRRRTSDMEWFDVAYRVYLVALGGGGLVLWLSGLIDDAPLSVAGVVDVRRHAPAVGGLLTAIALLFGLRSGSRGGPLAIEEAEVRHLLLAPISHEKALLRPALQRVRTLVGTGALLGALAGELFGRRLPGALGEWAISGAAAGAVMGMVFAAGSLGAHGFGIAEWQAGVAGGVLVAIQTLAATGTIPGGPFDTVGSLAVWPLRVRIVDLAAPIVALGALVATLGLLGRFNLELMSRRSALVAQLRFAVTMQDVRTVMLLRRQLSLEQTRSNPWFAAGARGSAPWRRSVRSLARFPVRRLGRMTLLSAGAGAALVGAFRGTTALFLVSGLACFLIGLEALEPLAQELDHPDFAASFPLDAGRLHQHLLLAPGLLLVVAAVPGLLTAWALEPSPATLGVGALLALPAILVGGAGGVLNTIGGAPDPFAAEKEGAFLPPEVVGLHLAFRMVSPALIAAVGSLPVVFVRAGIARGYDPVGVALRSAIGGLIIVTLVVWWVERRVVFRRWWRRIVDEGKPPKRPSGAPS